MKILSLPSRYRRFFAVCAGMICLVVGVIPGFGATFTLTTFFDDTFDPTLTPPFVGSGSFSFDAASPLTDGTYDWDSFTNLVLELTISGVTFTQADLATPSSEVNIEVRGGFFFFSNDFGLGSGPNSGSADFFDSAGQNLSTEPYDPNSGPLFGGGQNSPLFFAILTSSTVDGTYGVPVPEPSTFALLGVGVGLWICSRRRAKAG